RVRRTVVFAQKRPGCATRAVSGESVVDGARLPEGGHRDDRAGRRVAAQRTEERLAGEVEDAAVLADHQVAVGVADHAGDGLVQLRAAHRALARRLEGEDAAVV